QTGAGGAPALINILAASTPGNRLVGIGFGPAYSPHVIVANYGACGDFELANADWPASGSGTAETEAAPEAEQLATAYWAAADSSVRYTGRRATAMAERERSSSVCTRLRVETSLTTPFRRCSIRSLASVRSASAFLVRLRARRLVRRKALAASPTVPARSRPRR